MTAQEQEFVEYVQSGGQVETGDWMPDDYRSKLIKFIEMHMISLARYSSGIQSSTSTCPPAWTYSRNSCSLPGFSATGHLLPNDR